MASVSTTDCSGTVRILTLKDMKEMQEQFAKDAFEFLLKNAGIWIEYPKNFLTSHKQLDNSIIFTDSVGKAVVTIAYMLRIEYRKRFQNLIGLMSCPERYECYLSSFPISEDHDYFLHFMSWIAFAFDLTMYCYKEGYDYIKRGERCIANYPKLEYFHTRGGFRSLFHASEHIAAIYDRMEPVISKELPQDDVILPFIKRVEHMERRNRYNNKWLLAEPKMRHIIDIKNKLSAKYSVVADLDPRRVISGYKVILKKSPRKSPQKSSSESKESVSDVTKFDSGEKDETIIDLTSRISKAKISDECLSGSDISGSKSESLSTDSDPIFIVHKRFLDKREESRKDSKKRGLKICSPSKESGRFAMNLNQLLEEKIEGKQFSEIKDDIYSTCPPDRKIEDLDTQLIVLDTSSEEEEEDDVDSESVALLQNLVLQFVECVSKIPSAQETESLKKDPAKRREACENVATVKAKLNALQMHAAIAHEAYKSTRADSKESAKKGFSEKKSAELSKSTGAEYKERAIAVPFRRKKSASSRISEAEPKHSDAAEAKQSATEEHSEQKSFIPAESTGARPKIRKKSSKGSTGKVLPRDDRSGDLEESVEYKESRKSNSPKKSQRKGRK